MTSAGGAAVLWRARRALCGGRRLAHGHSHGGAACGHSHGPDPPPERGTLPPSGEEEAEPAPAPPPGADTGLPLDRLLDDNGERITVQAHSTCPGHAVRADTHRGYLDPATGLPPVDEATGDGDDQAEDDEQAESSEQDEDEEWAGDDEPADLVWGEYPTAVWVCTDPEAHGHRDRWTTSTNGYGEPRQKMADMDPKAAAAARAERGDVIESNKAWKAADPVRRDWLRALLTRKTGSSQTRV